MEIAPRRSISSLALRQTIRQPVTNLASDLASPQVAGAAVTFTATASDTENDPLQYMFLLDSQPKTSWADNPSWTWTTSATDIGSHSIEVRAKDSKHNPDGDSSKAIDFVISAPPNNPPAVTNLATDLASPQVAGAAVTFTATASDTENDPLQYMFLLDNQPKTSWADNPSWTWTTSATDIGSHSIEVRAKDSKHNPDGDSSKAIDFVISAPPNNPPAVTNLASDLASPQLLGTTVTWTASARILNPIRSHTGSWLTIHQTRTGNPKINLPGWQRCPAPARLLCR